MQSAYDYILDPKVKGIMADLAYPYVEAVNINFNKF